MLFALGAGKYRPMQTPTVQRPASRAPAQGDNLFQLLGTRFAPDAGAYMLMAACVMLPTVWLPDLKALSYLGFFGVGATITVLCAVAYTYLSGTPASGAQVCPEVLFAACCGRQQAVSLAVHKLLLPLCAHAALAAAPCAAPLSGVAFLQRQQTPRHAAMPAMASRRSGGTPARDTFMCLRRQLPGGRGHGGGQLGRAAAGVRHHGVRVLGARRVPQHPAQHEGARPLPPGAPAAFPMPLGDHGPHGVFICNIHLWIGLSHLSLLLAVTVTCCA